MVTFEDFKKLDVRIGMIVSAEKIPSTDKLLKLIINIGEEKRQVVAGIAKQYQDIDALVGLEIPVLVNLEPKEIRGHMSEGMILAANVNGHPVLLHPDADVPPGSMVR